MKIYTRKGDEGMTSLGTGQRVGKDDPRIMANGMMDELNCRIGLAKALQTNGGTRAELARLQQRLMALMAVVARLDADSANTVAPSVEEALTEVEWLERRIDQLKPNGPFAFVLPGADVPSAHLHLARTQCRTCERQLVTLSSVYPAVGAMCKWFNRVSDYLYALAISESYSSAADE